MSRKHLVTLSLACTAMLAAGLAGASPDAPASNAAPRQITISHGDARKTARGAPENFTGNATITPMFAATESTRAAGASVTFDAGARTVWHSHPAGQTLIVTAGSGWVQQEGGPRQELKSGDVVWTPPGVKHWHGATSSSSMTHLAIQEHVNGKVVEWLEPVTDAQYRGTMP